MTSRLELAPTLAALPGELRPSMDRLAAMGFRHVQLSAAQPGLRPRELDGSARRDLLATFRRRELEISGIDLWIPPSHYLDPVHVDRAVTATIAAIELAADLERCPLSITLPAYSVDPKNPEVDDAEEISTGNADASSGDAVQAIIDAAHHAGVALADHQVPVADRERDDLIGIGIDPAAWLAAGLDPAAGVSRQSGHLVAARLSDLLSTGLRGPIGTRDGRLDVMSYRVALAVAGHDRPVVLDARQWPNPWSDLETAAECWRRLAP
jgi:sugar phosphate isomerase/epimerase